ncbi:MAG TPA: ATP-binding cassette domain-containing protein [Prosthecobacter sp.]|nr:ATP-binding cassette domain-containing protein [Prosthecobacter sp.]HRK15895.1 ATP-binding cassette domain-containing protein [Prosthecobacter sp.]
MASLSAENLRFRHPGGGFQLCLESVEAGPGKALAVLGPSGSGKSTLLRLLAGLLSPGAGRVCVDGEDLRAMTPAQTRALRLRRMGLVFQDFALLDHLTVAENLLLPARFLGLCMTGARERARELAERLEVASFWDRPAARLSQGERQRVAVARALAHGPDLVFADEPTASLDSGRCGLVTDLLLRTCRESGGVLVMATHDARAAAIFPANLNLGDARA